MTDAAISKYALQIREDYEISSIPTFEDLTNTEEWSCTEYPVHNTEAEYYGTVHGYKYDTGFTQRFSGVNLLDVSQGRGKIWSWTSTNRETENPFDRKTSSSSGSMGGLFPRTFSIDDESKEVIGTMSAIKKNGWPSNKRFWNYGIRKSEDKLIVEKFHDQSVDYYCGAMHTIGNLDPHCSARYYSTSTIPAVTDTTNPLERHRRGFGVGEFLYAHSYAVCEAKE